jgi:hypothetical protein
MLAVPLSGHVGPNACITQVGKLHRGGNSGAQRFPPEVITRLVSTKKVRVEPVYTLCAPSTARTGLLRPVTIAPLEHSRASQEYS